MPRKSEAHFPWKHLAGALILAGSPSILDAQEPTDPVPCAKKGRIHRLLHKSAHTLQDKFIGYPETFVEPRLGHYLVEQMSVQVAKADLHRFTLYRSDFLPDSSLWSPHGASRFNVMFSRLKSWPGPIVIEWTPDRPGLAEKRRAAVLATLEKFGAPTPPERVVIGPSPYPGGQGSESANYYGNQLNRSQNAQNSFPLSPTESASSGVH
jgi:hypothetical protein